MCGIIGFVNLKDNLLQKRHIIEQMSNKLIHRGPDASGKWISANAVIGHRRLIVIDPKGGSQPMVRQQGDYKYVISYNGELYNTLELRKKLESRGHLFKSNSDTEVLLVAYIEWGSSCVEYLNGIYAFAIWSEKDKKLFLARDRFGVKPLFYAKRGDTFIFASELKAVLVYPDVEPEIASEGLAEIFALGPARTPGNGVFKGIYEVKPAHCMLYNKDGIHTRQYWSLKSRPHTDSEKNTIYIVNSLVRDAVERQLVTDVPLCTFLSGGLDSSAISSISSRYYRENGHGQLNTYSIDYVDNELYFKPSKFQPDPDAPWVKRMAKEIGSQHHYVKFDTPQLFNSLTAAVDARDLPGMADVDSSLWLFCKEVKKHFTVALSGECADEVFGGYPWFHMKNLMNSGTFPWSGNVNERKQILSPEMINTIKPEEYIQKRYRETLEQVPRLPGETGTEAQRRELFYLNITWFMSTLLDRKDRMSMAHGLEVRVPYCDHHLVQYVWNIPWETKMYGGREKGILRRALEGLLPDDVLYRKKSPYPKTHNPSYKKAVSEQMLEILADTNSPLLPLIDTKTVRTLAEGGSNHGKPWFGQLMSAPQMFAFLIQTEYWLRKYKVRIL